MGGSSFDLIAQEMLKQKQIMEQMEAENRELRHQLSLLREGRGIFVEIDGRRFALVQEQNSVSSAAIDEIPTVAAVPVPQQELVEQYEGISKDIEESASVPEAPQPIIDSQVDEEKAPASPTFLEEVMIDEFAAAATTPLAVWSGTPSAPAKSQEFTTEEEKATLRRQLIGSFLLE